MRISLESGHFFGRLVRIALLTATLWLSACASLPEQQAFNREAVPVERIVVLTMREFEVDLFILNNPGYSFGLIGAAVAESNRVPKRNKLRGFVAEVGFDPTETFRSTLVRELEARGYQVRWQEPIMESGKSPKQSRETYGGRKKHVAVSDADAQLDVNLGFYGYAAAGSSDAAPYRPTGVVSARLIDAQGKQRLFSDLIVYNNVFNFKKAVSINPDERFVYPDFDDLEAAGTTSVEGLKVAIEVLATELAARL